MSTADTPGSPFVLLTVGGVHFQRTDAGWTWRDGIRQRRTMDPAHIPALLDELASLRDEVRRLRGMTAVTLGFGTAAPQCQVHGDATSIRYLRDRLDDAPVTDAHTP